MVFAIRIHDHGGPDVLQFENVQLENIRPEDIRIAQTAIGVNFVDVYHRNGLYKSALPAIIGMEAAGRIVGLGKNVATLKVGDRVGYASAPIGAYASERIMPAARVVKLPDFLTDIKAAACLVKGMTAEFLLRRTYRVQSGDIVLVHAAAGGVGGILCQWAKHLGAVVIATAGSDDKCAIATAHGADIAVNYKTENFRQAVHDFTKGQGVHAVYDGVGAATFMDSLDCLRERGIMVSYGNASGPVPDFAPRTLASKGSLFLTRPSLGHYTKTEEEYKASAAALFDVLRSGGVRLNDPVVYTLENAAQAHHDLENRKITGAAVLVP